MPKSLLSGYHPQEPAKELTDYSLLVTLPKKLIANPLCKLEESNFAGLSGYRAFCSEMLNCTEPHRKKCKSLGQVSIGHTCISKIGRK
jgi:hypothetical protein